MKRHWPRRLAGMAGLLIASSAFTFALLEFAPGDFLSDARLHPPVTEETLRTLRLRYGLDQPLAAKYARWVKGLLEGDWGESLARGIPVRPLLWERASRTVVLAASAQLAAWLAALALAFAGLRRPGGAVDRVTAGVSHALLSLPEIVLALLVLLVMLRVTGGIHPTGAAFIALVLAQAPSVWRQARTALGGAARQPFVEAARDNELPEWLVLTHYVLPAAAPALVSLAGLSIGSLLSASLLVECIAGYPGLGPLLLDAVLARDVYVVVGGVFLSTLLWALGSLAADLAHDWLDPRVEGTA